MAELFNSRATNCWDLLGMEETLYRGIICSISSVEEYCASPVHEPGELLPEAVELLQRMVIGYDEEADKLIVCRDSLRRLSARGDVVQQHTLWTELDGIVNAGLVSNDHVRSCASAASHAFYAGSDSLAGIRQQLSSAGIHPKVQSVYLASRPAGVLARFGTRAIVTTASRELRPTGSTASDVDSTQYLKECQSSIHTCAVVAARIHLESIDPDARLRVVSSSDDAAGKNDAVVRSKTSKNTFFYVESAVLRRCTTAQPVPQQANNAIRRVLKAIAMTVGVETNKELSIVKSKLFNNPAERGIPWLAPKIRAKLLELQHPDSHARIFRGIRQFKCDFRSDAALWARRHVRFEDLVARPRKRRHCEAYDEALFRLVKRHAQKPGSGDELRSVSTILRKRFFNPV